MACYERKGNVNDYSLVHCSGGEKERKEDAELWTMLREEDIKKTNEHTWSRNN